MAQGANSKFLTDLVIERAFNIIKASANVIFADDKISEGNDFGIVLMRANGKLSKLIIGNQESADRNPEKLKACTKKATWGLRLTGELKMPVRDILNNYPEYLESRDYLYVGTAIDPIGDIFVAACGVGNILDEGLAEEMIIWVKKLAMLERDRYVESCCLDNIDRIQ